METPLHELCNEIFSLACDRPQNTKEPHWPNDYYGHATLLKKYAGFPAARPLPVSVVHGLRFDGRVWKYDFSELHTTGFVASPWHVDGLRGQVEIDVLAVGPLIHYAVGLWNAEQLAAVRGKLGRILLVYPVHSTHWVDTDYDASRFCAQIEAAAANFDSVVVCLYWRDVLRGRHREYMARGFLCVTNGHMFDVQFLERQRSLMEACSGLLTNGMGTHVGYAVYLGKPVQLLLSDVSYSVRGPGTIVESDSADRIIRKFAAVFAAGPLVLSQDQRDLAGFYWGFGSERSVVEMAQLFEESEKQRRLRHKCLDLREEFNVCTRIVRERYRELFGRQ
jgi:hypothetical protein